MIRRSKFQNISFAILAAASAPALSQTLAPAQSVSPLQEEIQWLQAETYVSTATKTLEDIKKSGASVSVITATDLRNMGARNLMDAIKRIPGLNVQTTNIGIPAVSVRGVKTDSSEKVLFMINGHSINNNLVNGGATWAYGDFQIDEIKRVEVVRGPGSALYGTNAFVAVINIVTKTAEDINGKHLTIGLGHESTKKLNIQMADSIADTSYAINLNVMDTNGISEHVESDFAEKSGSTDSWQKRYDLGFNVQIEDYSMQGKYVDRRSGPFIGIGNALNDESVQDYVEYFLELGHLLKLSEYSSIKTRLYHDHFEANNYWEILSEGHPGFGLGSFPDGALGSPTVENEKTGGEIQLDYKLRYGHKILAGISFEHQTQYNVRHFTNFDPVLFEPQPIYANVSQEWNWNGSHGRDTHALFIQDIWDLSNTLRLILGARRDYYSDFGKSINPRTSLTWEFAPDLSLTAVYGEAFRAPNFGELHNINNPSITGNPDLDPEKIETYELSLGGNIAKRTQFKITGFRNTIRNAIQYVLTGSRSVSSNVGKLRVTGFEMELSSRLRSGSSFDLNYTYQYPKNKLNDKRVAGVEMHKANASFNYRFSKLVNSYIGVSHRGELSRAAGDARQDLGSHTTIDLATNLRSESDKLSVKASIYNVLDKKYVDPSAAVASDLPTLGRSFMLEARIAL